VKVNSSHVYFIKCEERQAKRKQKRARVAAASAKTAHGNPPDLKI
jgi:hypothetical protein